MIVRVSVVLNMTVVNSNSRYSYSMYYIIHDCSGCHWLGLLNRVISKYVLLSNFTEKEKKKKSYLFFRHEHTFCAYFSNGSQKVFFFLEKEPFVSNPRFSQIGHETTNFTD